VALKKHYARKAMNGNAEKILLRKPSQNPSPNQNPMSHLTCGWAFRRSSMPMESHLAELERRHAALDRDIAQEWARPGADEIKLAELKRRKLQLKDEIAKLKSEYQTETVH
jgi:hypothetical protein